MANTGAGLIIVDFEETFLIHTEEELEAVFSRRHTYNKKFNFEYGAPVNDFLISHSGRQDDGHPRMHIMVNNDLAYIYYFPEKSCESYGCYAIGDYPNLSRNGYTSFHINGHGILKTPNHQVSSIATVLKVAKEFMSSPSLPKSVAWFHL